MHRDRKIALVVPAFRAQATLDVFLNSIPSLFDVVYVIDDASPDGQYLVVESCRARDKRIRLVRLPLPQGVAAAIAMGYERASADRADIAVVADPNGSMNLLEVTRLLNPIIDRQADFTKGNRFGLTENTIQSMPPIQFSLERFVAFLVRRATGFSVQDPEDRYTAISRRAMERINWLVPAAPRAYALNFLIRLSAYGFSCVEVPRTTTEKTVGRSGIAGALHLFTVLPMLTKALLRRLRFKLFYEKIYV